MVLMSLTLNIEEPILLSSTGQE
jgi:hypothetical protein